LYQPQAEELGQTTGNDMLCPSCGSTFLNYHVLAFDVEAVDHFIISDDNKYKIG
jgi:hypothetical protein